MTVDPNLLKEQVTALWNQIKATEEHLHRAQQKLKVMNDAFDNLKAEKNAAISLWQHRAEAMADPRPDSFFTEDENTWRKKAMDALEENGWVSPQAAAALRAEVHSLIACAPRKPFPADDLENP